MLLHCTESPYFFSLFALKSQRKLKGITSAIRKKNALIFLIIIISLQQCLLCYISSLILAILRSFRKLLKLWLVTKFTSVFFFRHASIQLSLVSTSDIRIISVIIILNINISFLCSSENGFQLQSQAFPRSWRPSGNEPTLKYRT